MITKFRTVAAMRTVLAHRAAIIVASALVALTAACGDDGAGGDGGEARIVVTTNILGDVVRELVGDDAEVEVIMPVGADPHELAPSPQQAAAMRDADVLVVNGLGFEVGLLDTIEAAEADGATVVTATDAIDPLPLAAGTHDDAAAEDAAEDDDHAGEDVEEHELDPHFFADPARMAEVAAWLGEQLASHVDALDTEAHRSRVDDYVAELQELDAEVADLLAAVPAERRVLVTNHEVFGYFADRYDFEVLGAVIPGGTTLAEPSAADLEDLAQEIAQAQVPAIFAESSSGTRLADALAGEGTQVEVVELYSESLGAADSNGATYVAMVRTNATRIAEALGG